MARVSSFLFALCFAIVVACAFADSAGSTPRPKPKNCDRCAIPLILWPVCGTNGVTYSNKYELNCKAECIRGLRIAHEGACRS